MAKERKVKDLMTSDPIVAELPGNRNSVVEDLIKHELTGMPVVKDGELKGLVTRIDIFNHPDEEQLALIYRKEQPVISEDTLAEEAAELFMEHETHYLPVKDDNNACAGILTTADMLPYIKEQDIKTPIKEVIERKCIPVYEKTPIKIVVQMMSLTNIYSFPVVDKDTKITGIVTDRDLFDLSEINEDLEESDVGIESDEDSWSWQGVKNVMNLYYESSMIELPHVLVEKVMETDPLFIYRETSASKAAELMEENDFGQLPVVDEMDNLENMVYELDLIKTLL